MAVTPFYPSWDMQGLYVSIRIYHVAQDFVIGLSSY